MAHQTKRQILRYTTVFLMVVTGCMNQRPGTNSLGQNESGQTPNVVMITISSLRADHLGCLGCSRNTTPHLDDFARRNVLFRNAFAASGWMMPAHGSIFTSLYPAEHRATHIDKSLADNCHTLAEILREHGYRTAGFSCNPRLDGSRGFAQGFDYYDDHSVLLMLNSTGLENEKPLDINKQRTNDLINDAALRWLSNNTHQPFFIFLHYYDIHWDYLPPAPYDKLYDANYDGPIDGTRIAGEPLFSNAPGSRDVRHIVVLYDGEIRQTDEDLDEFLEALRLKGYFGSSIIIVMGDHGEQFYEHGHTSHQGLFEELIHVPLAISLPAPHAQKRTVDSLVSQVDILPTILDYLKIPTPSRCCGRSLRPLIEGKAESVNEYIFAEYSGGAAPDSYAVRSMRYKFYEENGKAFAFDLARDPGEQHRILPADFTDDIKTLRQRLKAIKDARAQKQAATALENQPRKEPEGSLP